MLENVKRMTQQCIDDLMSVRGTLPNLEGTRPRADVPKATIESQSTLITDTALPTSVSTPALQPVDTNSLDVKPIVEPEIVLAVEALAAEPVVPGVSTPPTGDPAALEPPSLPSVALESAEVIVPVKEEGVIVADLEPGTVDVDGTETIVPQIEGSSEEGVH